VINFKRFIYYNIILAVITIIIVFKWWSLAIFPFWFLSFVPLAYCVLKFNLSRYIKDNYPDLYKRKRSRHRQVLDGTSAINIFKLSKSDIEIIKDEKIRSYIPQLRFYFKLVLIVDVIVILTCFIANTK
jgi:hypothetical protein